MKVLTIANQKGGVGKTAITFNLAHYAADQGLRVLVIDLDGQGNTSACLENGSGYLGASTLFSEASLPVAPGTTGHKNIWLIGSDASLHDAEALHIATVSHVRRHIREEIGPSYDLVLLDTPPAFGRRLTAALLSSDFYLVPFTPDPFSLDGVGKLYKSANAIKSAGNDSLRILGILPNKVNVRSAEQKKVLGELHKQVGAFVLPTMISERVSVSDALGRRQPAWKSPNGESARKGAQEMKAACEEILKRSDLL